MPTERILIVDDERLVRWSLRQKCEEWGYQVLEAEAGETGLRVAQDESPTWCCSMCACPISAALRCSSN